MKYERIIRMICDLHDIQLRISVGDADQNDTLGHNWINALHLNEATLHNIIYHDKLLNVDSNIENLSDLINK